MARWMYPCYKCKLYPCGDIMEPYCLILYADHDEEYRRVVKKYRLNKAEATALIMRFMGNGVCMSYQPIKPPVYNEKVRKAQKELEERWR